jgi:polyhydroxyalkanoate synthesis regulator phasin
VANKDSFQKYLDAGIAFTNLTRAKAEELVADLVQSGEFQGKDAKALVDDLLERARKSREVLTGQVRREVAAQLESLGISTLDDLAKQVAGLLGRTADAGKAATSGKKATAKKPSGKKAAADESPTKKSSGKKTSGKKSSAKPSTDTGTED